MSMIEATMGTVTATITARRGTTPAMAADASTRSSTRTGPVQVPTRKAASTSTAATSSLVAGFSDRYAPEGAWRTKSGGPGGEPVGGSAVTSTTSTPGARRWGTVR